MSTNVPGHEGIGRVVQGKSRINHRLKGGRDRLTISSGSGYDRGHDREARGREVSLPRVRTAKEKSN